MTPIEVASAVIQYDDLSDLLEEILVKYSCIPACEPVPKDTVYAMFDALMAWLNSVEKYLSYDRDSLKARL